MADIDMDMPWGAESWDAGLSQRAKAYIRSQTKRWVTRTIPNLEARERMGSRRRAKHVRVRRRQKWQKIRKDARVSIGRLLGAAKVLLGRSLDREDPGWAWKAFTHNKWADIWMRSGAAGPVPWTLPPPEEAEADESDESFSVEEGGSATSASTSS